MPTEVVSALLGKSHWRWHHKVVHLVVNVEAGPAAYHLRSFLLPNRIYSGS